jgi:hypothetical protein
MTGFAPSAPSAVLQDPTKHVNYALGMVLGVDDLTQEFGYLSHRDQWLARDALGYGTLWGLAVSVRIGARGPEVVVAPGAALNPRGQLIRVAPAQCAALNDWLQPRGADLLARRIPTADPNLFQLPLYLVLSYRTCLTDAVPIAGEPCRSEDDSTAPSRVADDFLLELQFDPPPQQEEDAVRALVQWLRAHVAVTAAGTPSLSVPQFLDAIRAAAAAAQAASSPPSGNLFLGDTSPPTLLSVPAASLPLYLRAAARLWVTELRPLWRPDWLGQKHACAGSELLAAPQEGNRVLLAKLLPTIGPDGLDTSVWKVQGAVPVLEETRPFLLQERLLEEWLLTSGAAAAAAGPRTVAAGIVNGDGSANGRATAGGLSLSVVGPIAGATSLRLSFDGYAPPPSTGGPQYLLKALPWSPLLNLTATFAGFVPDGLLLSVSKGGAALAPAELSALKLMVEVTQVG